MFIKTIENGRKIADETYDLPSTGTGYSTVIDFINYSNNRSLNHEYYPFIVTPSAITGTNLDIALYGALTKTGTKVLLQDAIVADLTADATAVSGLIDVAAYPMPYYFIGWIVDTDESANTISLQVIS